MVSTVLTCPHLSQQARYRLCSRDLQVTTAAERRTIPHIRTHPCNANLTGCQAAQAVANTLRVRALMPHADSSGKADHGRCQGTLAEATLRALPGCTAAEAVGCPRWMCAVPCTIQQQHYHNSTQQTKACIVDCTKLVSSKQWVNQKPSGLFTSAQMT